MAGKNCFCWRKILEKEQELFAALVVRSHFVLEENMEEAMVKEGRTRSKRGNVPSVSQGDGGKNQSGG